MDTSTLVPVEEYLRTSFPDGDREYVDGRVVERNLGDLPHSNVQTRICVYLAVHYPKFWSGVEVRVQVRAKRFRIPDVTLIAGNMPSTRIIQEPPFVVVEILSPDDRAGDLEDKIEDYLAFGISRVWVVNPRTRRGYIYTSDGMREAKDGILRAHDPDIEVPLAEVMK
jgi:Uma2 family endonuclease